MKGHNASPYNRKFFLKDDFFMNFSKNDIDLFFSLVYITKHPAGVAKLVIALACHAGDHGFEPRHSR